MAQLHQPTTSVLYADDDPLIRRLVARNLVLAGYVVEVAADGREALDAVLRHTPSLVLLDVMMPKLDGFAVCEAIREVSSVPIIMLTARGADDDRVRGLNAGADDYLSKPFNVEELLARVRAVLRRSQLPRRDGMAAIEPCRVGDLQIDFEQYRVTLAGRELDLTPIEYRLLTYFVQNAGRIMTHDLLLEHVWGPEYLGESHLLQVNVNRLRHKLEADPAHPRYVLTRIGIGYQLAAHPLPPPQAAVTAARSLSAAQLSGAVDSP
jgi:DNA-binding response OmpR family regulator